MHAHDLLAGMLVLSLALAAGCNAPSLEQHPAERVADAYRIDGWDRIERLDFTFNVQSPGRDEPTVRQWSWHPRTDEVTRHDIEPDRVTSSIAEAVRMVEGAFIEGFENEGEVQDLETQVRELRYRRDAIDEISDEALREVLREIDHQFINDSYWLLFPFQIVWSNPTVTHEGEQPLPMGEGTAPKVTAQFPDEGGYTPGDAYDLYLDENHRVQQWVFRRGGRSDGRPATWEDHRQLGPIIVSLGHRGPDDEFRLWFTDVRAELTDAEDEVTPVPMER